MADEKKGKVGRHPTEINEDQLKALMRLIPSKEDAANFFDCSTKTIERFIRDKYDLTFTEFRERHMVHTRLALRRKALEKAKAGDNTMLIWCMKNIDDWTDKVDQPNTKPIEITLNYSLEGEGE